MSLPVAAAECNIDRNDLLILDYRRIADQDRAELLTRMAQITPIENWTTKTLEQPETLGRLVNDLYGLRVTSDRSAKSAEYVGTMIAQVNKLSSPKLQRGLSLKVPPLPFLPREDASLEFAQVLVSGSVRVLRTELALQHPTASSSEPMPAANASAVLVIPMHRRAAERLGTLVDFVSYCIAIDNPSARLSAQTPTAAELDAGHPDRLELADRSYKKPHIDLSSLTEAQAGHLYVIDKFHGKCSHGEKVLEVIAEVLARYGATQLLPSVIGVDALATGLVEPRQTSDGISILPIRTFIDEYLEDNQTEQSTRALEKKRLLAAAANMHGEISPLVLKRLMTWLSADYSPRKARVISMSIFVEAGDLNLLQGNHERNWPAMFGAVSENHTYIEELNGAEHSEEPALSFYKGRGRLAVALVGTARLESGILVHAGMRSYYGDGVAYVAQGFGWGSTHRCLRAGEYGTSFATPLVAAQLYLAAASWRAAGEKDVSATEALTRAKLSSKISERLAGDYASAGPPQMSRLLATGGDFVIQADGSPIPISLTGEIQNLVLNYPGETAEITPDSLPKTVKRVVSGSWPSDNVDLRGIQIAGGRYFAYYGNEWYEISLFDVQNATIKLHLEFPDKHVEEFTSLQSFANKYWGVVAR
jgi:hypothetical protein